MPDEIDPFWLSEEFPLELMHVSRIEDVIAFLRAVPLPASSKKRKLYFWGKSLGVLVDPAYYARLGPSGVQ